MPGRKTKAADGRLGAPRQVAGHSGEPGQKTIFGGPCFMWLTMGGSLLLGVTCIILIAVLRSGGKEVAEETAAAPSETPAHLLAGEPANATAELMQRDSNAPFVHPGLLHTEADFERMRTKVQAGAQPWLDGWNRLTGSRFAQLGFQPRPVQTPVRGTSGPHVNLLLHSAHAAYLCAVRWKVSGDEAYAKKSIEIMNTCPRTDCRSSDLSTNCSLTVANLGMWLHVQRYDGGRQ